MQKKFVFLINQFENVQYIQIIIYKALIGQI